jgi:branched-chain amino acid transport system ATP-binding protein
MLEISGLHAAYGQVQVLKGIDLAVRAGEIVTLIGPNGAGKTTLLLSIMGFLRGLQGKLSFAGENILNAEPERIVGLGLSMVPEDRGLFPPLTVGENLLLGAYLRLTGKGKSKAVRIQVNADLEQILELFPILKSRLKQPVGTLSGGQQQMVAIGRAFMTKPRLLLLDEPSLGLAPLVIKEIFKAISVLNQNGVTVLLVEQNANLALKLAHQGYVIENGRIQLSGSAAELMDHPEVKQAYLGREHTAS